jgi:hypothetical protein
MAKFEAEDFARLFIREFLKKNQLSKTYATLMEEDKRPAPGGTMQKSELTKLLGMDALEKNNKRSKQYSTMLDMVCGYLMKMTKHKGGVTLPGESNSPQKV